MKHNLKARRTLLTTSLGAAVLAACGGGGGDAPAPAAAAPSPSPAPAPAPAPTTGPAPAPAPTGTTVTGPTYTLKSDVGQVVAFVGDTKTPVITVTDSTGATVTTQTVTWTTSNAAVATVTSAGVITIVGAGLAEVKAAVTGAELPLTVTGKAVPTTLAGVREAYPYIATSTAVPGLKVLSDISDTFSQQRLANLEKGWLYLKNVLYGAEPTPFEFFYTVDSNLMVNHAQRVIGGTNPNAASEIEYLGTGGNLDAFYVKTTDTDFAQQQHELGERFILALDAGGRSWAWLYEGMGLYCESGRFESASVFTNTRPRSYIISDFNDKVNTPQWKTLSEIFTLDYATLTDKTLSAYTGAGILMFFLQNYYPNVLPGLLAGMRTDTITSSDQARDYILAQTGLTIGQLDIQYRDYGIYLKTN